MFLHNKAIITLKSPRSTTLAQPCVRYGKCHPESSKEVFFPKLWDTHKMDSKDSEYMATTFSSKECDDCDLHTTWKMKKFTSKRIAAKVLCGVLQAANPSRARPHQMHVEKKKRSVSSSHFRRSIVKQIT